MILALITSLALLFDDEREEFNRTGNIVPGVTLISFFAASFSSAMPEPTGPVEEAAGAPLREFSGWATLGSVRDAAHSSAPRNGHRNPARPRSAVVLLVFMIFSFRFPTVFPSLDRLLSLDARSRKARTLAGVHSTTTFSRLRSLGWNTAVTRRTPRTGTK